MKINISEKKTVRFTKEAKKELSAQVNIIVNNIVEEAERMEAMQCDNITEVQITPNVVKRAVEYIIKFRFEKRKVHWAIAYLCPFLDSIAGIVFAMCLEKLDDEIFVFIAIVSFSTMAIAVTCQIMYHIKSN